MWLDPLNNNNNNNKNNNNNRKNTTTATTVMAMMDDESDLESDSSGEEIPIWVRGEQRWVSGIVNDTTCQDVITVLLQDEEIRGRHVGISDQYQITERWRGVEQPLDSTASILDIWNAWGTAQPEVKISLRRIKNDLIKPLSNRRSRCAKSDSSSLSDYRNAWRTVHPKRLQALQNEKQPSSTEELLKLVLAQGEVIRRQLKKLRHNEHQIGFLEDKTHKARVRKHGSNYLLETYLKGLSEGVDTDSNNNKDDDDDQGVEDDEEEHNTADKNSDSGVVTESSSEQSNFKKNPSPSSMTTTPLESPFERFSPSSDDFNKDIRDDDTSSTISEITIREQIELFDMIHKMNKRLLKEEEGLVRLHANLKKYDKNKVISNNSSSSCFNNKNYNNNSDTMNRILTNLRAEMAKSACEMQHNEVVLEETREFINNRRSYLDTLHKDLMNEEHEHDMLQTLLYTQQKNKEERYHHLQQQQQPPPQQQSQHLLFQKQQQHPHQKHRINHHQHQCKTNYTKELLDTLV